MPLEEDEGVRGILEELGPDASGPGPANMSVLLKEGGGECGKLSRRLVEDEASERVSDA